MSQAAFDDVTPIKSFFLKLVGKAPEQVKAQKEFEESLKKVDSQTDVLDSILEDIDRINETTKQRAVKMQTMTETLRDSMLPSKPSEANG